MRKAYKDILILASIVIMTFVMVSCSANNINTSNSDTNKTSSDNKADTNEVASTSKEDNISLKSIDDKANNMETYFDSEKYNAEELAVFEAFSEAERICAWFTELVNIDFNSNTIVVNSWEYNEVEYKNITTMDGLKDYLGNYFDDKTIKELLNIKLKFSSLDKEHDIFVEVDGKLYYLNGFDAQVSYKDVDKHFNIIKNNDNKFTITVDMIWKGIYKQGPYKYASYDYIFEKVDDKWIFTNFKLPFTYCTENGVEKPDILIKSKSPDNKYTFEFNKENGFFDIYKDDIILLGYSIEFDMSWDEDIMELQEYWWDLEFNKLYMLVGPNINPVSHIYCIDLAGRDVTYYDTVRYNLENINKKTNYIYFTNRWKSLDVYTSNEDYYINKKYGYYIYNLRTNEKFYLNSDDDYTLKQLNDTSIIYTQYCDGKKSGEFSIDISLYVDKNRGKYINKIKNAIVKACNSTIRIDNIELCQIFTTKQGNYQIVKINSADKSYSYELWKIDNNNYERVINNADNIFLTNNHKYLCTTDKNGELKVYDNKFEYIIKENVYSERLLNKYDLDLLDIGNHYIMNIDEYIFLTIKSDDNLVDVVNINLKTKELDSLPYEIDCSYNNHFINTDNGYMIYQTGPSVSNYNENSKRIILDTEGAQRSLMTINLLNKQQREIDSDNCLFTFFIESQKDSLTYNKYIKSVMSSDTEKNFYFDKEFIGE